MGQTMSRPFVYKFTQIVGLGESTSLTGLESVVKSVDESPDLLGISVVSAKTPICGVPVLTPDLMGFYTLTLPVPQGSDLNIFSALQEDISWFDTPVSILCIENKSEVQLSRSSLETKTWPWQSCRG